MEGRDGFQAKGSFGIPEGIKKQIEQQKNAPPVPQDGGVEARIAPQVPNQGQTSPAAPEAVAAAAAATKEFEERKAKDRAQMLEIKSAYEENLGIKIDEEDVRDYIFKGRVAKEVTIIPGYMKGTLQTLTTKESGTIDEQMAKVQLSMKLTPQGYDNERAIYTLSYAWTHAQNKNEMRMLGTKPEEREETIRGMGGHTVDLACEANVQLNWLLKYAMREKGFLKKS
jgi:hypothetical protein